MLTEKLLQFIWNFQYLNVAALKTVQGEPITVLHRGTHNHNQGPDFLNAKIKIGKTVLVGNIELHLSSKDWFKHRHAEDSHYQNIILHLVWEHDIAATKIHQYPVIELKSFVAKIMLERYAVLLENAGFIPCENQIQKIAPLYFNNWKDRLLLERLEQKTGAVLAALQRNKLDWEETFWQQLAKNFGGKVNGEAFEAMAQKTPHLLLAKNKMSLVKLESILLGQTGMLQGKFYDAYVKMLQKEYAFLQKKYQLSIASIRPQYLRMRPQGFPTIRLSQLAALIYHSNKLFSKIIACTTYQEAEAFFAIKANDYWNYHYKLDEDETPYKEKHLGTDMVHNIMINTVVPVVFAYGIYKNEETYKQKAILWLEQLPSETNTIIKGFRSILIKSKTAADSQALLQLKNQYCKNKLCLQCAIGASILSK